MRDQLHILSYVFFILVSAIQTSYAVVYNFCHQAAMESSNCLLAGICDLHKCTSIYQTYLMTTTVGHAFMADLTTNKLNSELLLWASQECNSCDRPI